MCLWKISYFANRSFKNLFFKTSPGEKHPTNKNAMGITVNNEIYRENESILCSIIDGGNEREEGRVGLSEESSRGKWMMSKRGREKNDYMYDARRARRRWRGLHILLHVSASPTAI